MPSKIVSTLRASYKAKMYYVRSPRPLTVLLEWSLMHRSEWKKSRKIQNQSKLQQGFQYRKIKAKNILFQKICKGGNKTLNLEICLKSKRKSQETLHKQFGPKQRTQNLKLTQIQKRSLTLIAVVRTLVIQIPKNLMQNSQMMTVVEVP